MKSKAERTILFLRTLKFQNFILPILLAVAVLLLTAVLSVQAGSSVASVEAAASELVCPADIISYWTLDETTGSPYADSILDNDATCGGVNCPTSVPGLVNQALSFDGNKGRLTVNAHSSLDWTSSDSFSVELWVQTSQNCSGDKVFAGKHEQNGPHWWLGCRQSGDQGLATFSLRDDNNNHLELLATQINDGNWHHLVAIRNAGTSENLLYVDGVAASATQNYTGSFANNNSLTIGHRGNPNQGFANAIIDEVALYSRALIAAEINDHFNSGAGKAYCTEVVAPVITPIPNQGGVVGQLFTYDVEASGNPAPTFALTTHPAGMTIDANTGLISWTPAASGIFDVTVEATNSAGVHNASFTIEVTAAPVLTAISDQTAVVGQLFTYDVEASGDPAPTFSLFVSPAGMTIDANTGLISWTPAATGVFDVTVQATNDVDSDMASFTITVNSLPVLTPIPNQTAVVGQLFTYDVEASGDPAPTFSLLVSPAGMAINPTTGVITWTPTSAGNVNVSVRAENTAGGATANFTITVAEPGEVDHFLFLPIIIRNP